MYREKVNRYRIDKLGQPSNDINDKYDPANPDENDFDNAPQFVANSVLSNNSDEYDSDSEYMQESMERNLKNMKRRIDSGGAKKRYAESTNYSSDEDDKTDEEDHMEMYRKIQMRESALSDEEDLRIIQSAQQPNFNRGEKSDNTNDRQQIDFGNRKKRSRWGDAVEAKASSQQMPPPPPIPPSTSTPPFLGNKPAPMLSAIRRTDPALLNYARQNYGTTDLTEEDWNKCEEHFKVNLLYQDMMRKREEFDRLAKSGKHKYEYDSDEDTTGGTWEHKIRTAEMDATAAWADALTKQSEGKHHIGDFLPPEEVSLHYHCCITFFPKFN